MSANAGWLQTLKRFRSESSLISTRGQEKAVWQINYLQSMTIPDSFLWGVEERESAPSEERCLSGECLLGPRLELLSCLLSGVRWNMSVEGGEYRLETNRNKPLRVQMEDLLYGRFHCVRQGGFSTGYRARVQGIGSFPKRKTTHNFASDMKHLSFQWTWNLQIHVILL